jgi:hypothetical protein
MQTPNDPLRDRLLGRVPQPADLASYKASVTQLLDQNQKSIKRERIFVTAFWIFCVVSATVRLWFSAESAHFPREPFLACIFFVWGGVEMVKHHINSSRVEVLKEIKQLQLHVFELDQALAGPPSLPDAG